MTELLRIGTGAGFSADRLDPACELVEKGNLAYIVFEYERHWKINHNL